jgi:hypothetical protein
VASYEAVLKPIEGTILTVVRETADAAVVAASRGENLVNMLRVARSAGREALANTPELLPVLKDAGVVDAGGAGFMLFIDSALHVVAGDALPEPEDVAGPSAEQLEAVSLRAGADGAHMRVTTDTLEKLVPDAIKSLKKEDRILGIGGLRAKHDAMIAGEYDVDYVSFGDPAPDGYVPPIDQIAERAGWWAEIFNVPCVAHAANIADVATLTKVGADFISLREAIWDDARGPVAAMQEAQGLLDANANARERE